MQKIKQKNRYKLSKKGYLMIIGLIKKESAKAFEQFASVLSEYIIVEKMLQIISEGTKKEKDVIQETIEWFECYSFVW